MKHSKSPLIDMALSETFIIAFVHRKINKATLQPRYFVELFEMLKYNEFVYKEPYVAPNSVGLV